MAKLAIQLYTVRDLLEQEQFDKPTIESAKISLENLKNIRNEANSKIIL